MHYEIEHGPDSNMVVVRARGKQDPAAVSRAVAEAIEVARSSDRSRFLFDMREFQVIDTPLDTFRFAGNLDVMGFQRSDRIASLFAGQADRHGFAETVAVNRGWNVKYFTDEAEALLWLADGTPSGESE